MDYLKFAKNVLLAFGIVMLIVFAIPIVSTIIVFNLSNFIGCNLSAAGPSECVFLGIDIGERLYGYTVPLVGSILAPVTFLLAFWDIIAVWLLCFILVTLAQRYRKQCQQTKH